MRAAIYVRVSLDNGTQTTVNQELQLTNFAQRQGWNLITVFRDEKTGKNHDRPGLKSMLAAASRKEFDLILFWDLSRLSRAGVSDTLKILEQLRAWGVGFRSLQEPFLDSLGPFADVIISLLACIAKLEREKISERTRAGLERTRKAGTVLGRPRKELNKERVLEMLKILNPSGVAEHLGVSESTIYRLMRQEKDPNVLYAEMNGIVK